MNGSFAIFGGVIGPWFSGALDSRLSRAGRAKLGILAIFLIVLDVALLIGMDLLS